VGVKKPSTEFLAHDALYATRLVEAVTRLASEHATEHRLTPAAVLGSLSWVLGRMIGMVVRDSHADFESCLEFLACQVRRAALGEIARRALLH